MNFDLLYNTIGEFGLYQKYIVFVGSLTSSYAGLLFVNSVFVLGIPKHRCALPGWENDTYDIQNAYHFDVINITIPPPPQDEAGDGVIYDQCNYYVIGPEGGRTLTKCIEWVYDKSVFTSTLAADLNMVCDRSIMKSNAQMLFFGGLLTGSLLTGLFSDRFGRKMTMMLSSIFYFVAALAIAWTPNYGVYTFLMFAVGFFAVGNFMPCFVLGMEFVGPSYRRVAGVVGGFHWSAGNLILAALGYGIRNWVTLQIVCAAPGIFFQLWWKYFPESPRWLYTQGRHSEAEDVIRSAAKWNKAELPEKILDDMCKDYEAKPTQGKLWDMFKHRVLCIRVLIIFFNWFVVCLAYYGLALNSGDLGGDLYLNFFLQALMDLPATLITLVLLDRTGRKPLMVASMLVAGFGCLATVFTIVYGGSAYVTATRVLAMVGKIGASAAFSMVYVYSAELLPTVVRNAGMGASSCMARVGGMVAPYIADLDRLVGGRFGPALPQLVFGALSVVAGISALYLPETLNKNLPETIEQAKTVYQCNGQSDNKEIAVHVNKAFSEEDQKTKL